MTQPLSPAAPSSLSSLGAAQTGAGARVRHGRPVIFIDTDSEPGSWERHLRHTAAMRERG
jgi:hypothetical protein